MKDEIKIWKTNNLNMLVCRFMISQGIAFRYTEEEGIVFTAPESFIGYMTMKLKQSYGSTLNPCFEEVK